MFKKLDTIDAVEAIDLAGHNFTVEVVPIKLANGFTIPDKRMVVRADTGGYLGTVGTGWAPVQPSDFYNLAGMIAREAGGKFGRSVTLNHGGAMGVEINFTDQEFVRGDRVSMNLILMTSFDMSYTLMGRAVSMRWFCLNQLPSSSKVFSLKHTTNVLPRLESTTKILGYFTAEMRGFNDLMKQFTHVKFNDKQAIEWFGSVLGGAPEQPEGRAVTIFDNQMADFQECLVHGKGTELPGVRGTAWGALNAMTEWANHIRTTRVRNGRDEESVRFESVTFGSADRLMQSAVAKLKALVS